MIKVLLFFLIIYIIFKAGRFFGQVESKIKAGKEANVPSSQDLNSETKKKTSKKNKNDKLEEAEYQDL